jgi:hypothetical protein
MRAVHKDGYIYIMAVVPSLVASGNVILKYNISTDSYEEITAPDIRIRYSSGAVVVDDDIYVFADRYYTSGSPATLEYLDYTTPYIYNITSDTWSVGEPSSELFDRGYAIYYDGLIYVQRSLKFQAYNPTTDSWVDTLTPPIYGIVHNGLFQEHDGKIFVGSGWQSDISDNSPYFQYYDVENDKWYVATRLEENLDPIGYGSLFLLNEKIFYIGGYSNEDSAVDNRVIRSFGIEKLQFKKFNEIDDTTDEIDQEISDMKDGTSAFTEISLDDGLGNIEKITHASKKALDIEVARLEADKADKTYVDSQDALDEKVANKAVDFSVVNDTKYPTTEAVKEYVDTRQTSVYDFKGSVLFANLPTTNQKVGDTYNITDNFTLGGEDYLAGTNVAWNGTGWDALGSHIPIASEIDYDNTGSTLVAVNVKTAIDELDSKKIDKDFTPYTELTTDLSDDDYVIVRDISNNQTKKTKVSTLRQFETDTYEYGIRWVEGQSSSTLERVKIVNGEMTVGSATNLVANVGIDDQVVENSFDNINIFIRNRVVIDGNTMVRVNKYYIREYSVNDGGTIRNYILMCEKKLTGYRLPIRFDNGDGTEKDYAYLPAYEGYIDENGVGRSISGVLPTTSISRNNSRIACRKNDGDGTNTDSLWGQVDFAEYYDLVQVPIWIEFANFDTQAGIGRGVVDLGFDENTVADSTVANTAIIANNSNFDVGMTIYLSTGTYHQITQIDVDTPIAGQTTLTFNGETVTPLTGVNIDPRQYYTGMTDSVVASTGFYKANDGKHPFKWRGMENVWGNIWKFVDGVKISNWYAWVSTNPAHYDDLASDVNGDYGSNWTKLSYQNALSNGYISKLGYDDRFPFARLPIEVGAGSTTYYADYYYQNSGDRTLLVGGSWYYSSDAGLTVWFAIYALSNAGSNVGFRLSYRP